MDESGRLVVVETETAFMVVAEDDPDDWIASFNKSAHFPAREWAERMAALYNLTSGRLIRPPFAGFHPPKG